MVRSSIDQGLPCFGWELEIPEYYVVHAYDEIGYHFSGRDAREARDRNRGQRLAIRASAYWRCMSSRRLARVEDPQVVKRALMFALEHSIDESKWVLAGYHAGLAGYDAWIASLDSGRADSMGAAYNSAVWNECRGFALQFLRGARCRLNGMADEPLSEAIDHYQTVSEQLSIVADQFPFVGMNPKHVKSSKRIRTSIDSLLRAKSAAGKIEH